MFQGRGFPASEQRDRACRVGCSPGGAGTNSLCRRVGDQPCLPILSRLQDVFVGKLPLFLQVLMKSCGGQPCFQAQLLCSSKSILLGNVDEGFDRDYPPFLTYSIIFLKVTVRTVGNDTGCAHRFSSSSPRWQFAFRCFVPFTLFLIFTLRSPWVIKKNIIN